MFSFFSTVSYFFLCVCGGGLLWTNIKPIRGKVIDRLKCLNVLKFVLTSLKSSGASIRPPPPYAHTSFQFEGGGTWVQKLSTDIFNSDFGRFIFKRYETEQNFEMLLIKWRILYASNGPSKNTSKRYFNHIRLTVKKTEIFE